MKILIVGYNDVCGVLSGLRNAVNTHTKHTIVLATKTKEFYFSALTGADLDLADSVKLAKAADDCDVIHYNDMQPDHSREFYHLPTDKFEVTHVHGTSVRRVPVLYAPPNMPVLYSTPDLEGFLSSKQKIWLPNPVRQGLPEMISGQTEAVICHTPTPNGTIDEYIKSIPITSERAERYGYVGKPHHLLKHSDLFMSVCQHHSFPFKLIGRLSNTRCIEEMRGCSVLFDNIFFGSYGMSAVEALAMGMNVMCRISGVTNRHLMEASHLPCPIVNTREDQFIDAYTRIRREFDWSRPNKDNQRWVEAVHGQRSVALRYTNFLEGCFQ